MSSAHTTPAEDLNKKRPAFRADIDSSFPEGASMLHEQSMLASLWSNLRDAVFPLEQPPLVLESKPIAVVDRMATKQDPKATAAAVVTYGLLITLLLVFAQQKRRDYVALKPEVVTGLAPPPIVAQKAAIMRGGGGQRGWTPVTKGQLPKVADTQIMPPNVAPMEQPKIPMPEPTIEVQSDLKMAESTLPNIGMPNSPQVGTSMGNGGGTGIGSGRGSGLGQGSGGNSGGGPKRIGGGVSMPVLIHEEKAEFSEQARKAKFIGIVVVSLWIDEHGNPLHVQLLHGVGMGLDENAIAAVKEYRFKPAMEGGRPVMVALNVAVDFQIE